MTIILTKCVDNAWAHQNIGSFDLRVSSHDDERGTPSVSLCVDAGNQGTNVHLSIPGARQLGEALIAAANALDQASIAKAVQL